MYSEHQTDVDREIFDVSLPSYYGNDTPYLGIPLKFVYINGDVCEWEYDCLFGQQYALRVHRIRLHLSAGFESID